MIVQYACLGGMPNVIASLPGGRAVMRCGRARLNYADAVEFVIAPIAELRAQITHLFEEAVGSDLDHSRGAAAEPYRFTCALTGGSTALIFLGALREADVPWQHVTLYWGDDRAVPPDHPDSNYALAERLLLTPLGGHAPHAARMRGEADDLEQAAREYDKALPPALDLIILGVGHDGHVCSLFPGHPALQVEDRRVLAILDSPKPPPRRLTLSLPYVCASRRVWIVAVGPRKLPLLQRAASSEPATTPLDFVVRGSQNVTIFTDQNWRRK
jgi:6-phosphogluconolactonase